MKTLTEIKDKIKGLTPDLELAQESYFSIVKDKQEGKEVSKIDFMRIESEYEILKKEVETLEWALEKEYTIELSEFGEILIDKHSKDVYQAIREMYDEKGKVIVSFIGVGTFQTTFARDTFGKIYHEIGRVKYNVNITYEGVTRTHMALINEGIVSTTYA